MRVLADTCFFIDLERRNPEAIQFLRSNPAAELTLCEVVRAELLAVGRDLSAIEIYIAPEIAPLGQEAAAAWSRSVRYLRQQGQLIGVNDLWIAAVAIANNLPVLTRNRREFERVPDLTVITY
ncbi:MAG: type II toxin-antitoxin system VapC family toxin [Fimbriimonas sp.]